MQPMTPQYLPGFHMASLRRTPRSASQKLADKLSSIKQKSISQLGECFVRFIPSEKLDIEEKGLFSRRRLFSKDNTFWAFFSQVLDADGGCQEVVKKMQAFAALKSHTMPSSSTAAYCKARKNLAEADIRSIFEHTTGLLKDKPRTSRLDGRRVVVVDGTGVSMPDTKTNQAAWPQQRQQTVGCGFPQAKVCACFSLRTGTLLSYRLSNRKKSELTMLREQVNIFRKGDIFLGDKGFCSYYDQVNFKEQGIDSVVTLARRTPVSCIDAASVLGENDLLIQWPKPKWNKRLSYSKETWESLPDSLMLRQIRVEVTQPGFRVKSFYIVTTLTDHNKYPASDIADLYYQRWDVELFFRDIKTTMGMDILRCKTPAMIKKEILMHFIAYNCIRVLMYEAAEKCGESVRQISFKRTIQSLRQWESVLNSTTNNQRELRRMKQQLYEVIASGILIDRPGRREPRCLKRRHRGFALMVKPRHEMMEAPHRSRYHAKAP